MKFDRAYPNFKLNISAFENFGNFDPPEYVVFQYFCLPMI